MAFRFRIALIFLVAACGAVTGSLVRHAEFLGRTSSVRQQSAYVGLAAPNAASRPVGSHASGDSLAAIARELRDAPDLKAAYEKYKDAPDPTGRIAYLLAGWIGDCPSYIHESPEAMDRYFRVTPEMRANARRNEMIARAVARCAGFDRHDPLLTSRYMMQLWKDLHERALHAGYPGERARVLAMAAIFNRGSASDDQEAIGLLSGPLDAEVVKYVGQYIHGRNGPDWPEYGTTGRAIWFSAWTLLECDFGADCGANSRPVQVNCTHFGYCGMAGIEDVLLVQPNMTEQRLQVSNEVRAALRELIENRDWVHLGFRAREAGPAR